MSADCFQMAAEGWQIISRYEDSRQSARILLRWLIEALNLSAIGLNYHDTVSGYEWNERVSRFFPGRVQEECWEQAFPEGPSRWLLEGNRSDFDGYSDLLNLLAHQWLFLGNPATRFRGENSRRHRKAPPRFPSWQAVSREARLVQSRLPELALSGRPLLLIGESGSGKSHLAGIIHRNGPDPSAPFSTARENSSGGTLYIEEWEVLSEEEKTRHLGTSGRLIAAARPMDGINSLRKRWAERTGRQGITMTVPPLRERREDIPILAGCFLELRMAGSGDCAPGISPKAVEALQAYPWPGNARELRECMEEVLEALQPGETLISPNRLPPAVRGILGTSQSISFPERLFALENEALRRELRRQHGNISRTARALGLTPRQVSWRVRKYGIDPRDYKPHLPSER